MLGPARCGLQGAVVQAHAPARVVLRQREGTPAPAAQAAAVAVADVERVYGRRSCPRACPTVQRHMLHNKALSLKTEYMASLEPGMLRMWEHCMRDL